MEGIILEKAYERLLRYVMVDTRSEDECETVPSTAKQFKLAEMLVEELKAFGIQDAHVDDKCYVMGTLKGNVANVPTIGLIAHVDTSPDFNADCVKPIMHRDYDGKDIVLNAEQNIIMDVKSFPELLAYKGQDLITTDGTTLLGADDKAGIAEIMTVLEMLVDNPELPHGDIKIAFTPDEEVGRGADFFNVEKFGADFAYTIDGGEIGELEYENFNAASAKVTVKGRNIHPGNAKNKMINSLLIAHEYIQMLPAYETPATTEGYEGFYHLTDMSGDIELTNFSMIIRDHDMAKFEKRKAYVQQVCDFLNAKYGEGTLTVEVKDSYYNMKEKVEPVIEIVETVKEAMEQVGVVPLIKAIRGGTDGSRLSYMGLPCPNIFTGGHNYHGRFEYIPVQSMDAAVLVILKTLELHATRD
jgi:tripeptide aminopeptidase